MSPDSLPTITLLPTTIGEVSLRPGSGKRHSSLPSLARSASASPWSTPGAFCRVTA